MATPHNKIKSKSSCNLSLPDSTR